MSLNPLVANLCSVVLSLCRLGTSPLICVVRGKIRCLFPPRILPPVPSSPILPSVPTGPRRRRRNVIHDENLPSVSPEREEEVKSDEQPRLRLPPAPVPESKEEWEEK